MTTRGRSSTQSCGTTAPRGAPRWTRPRCTRCGAEAAARAATAARRPGRARWRSTPRWRTTGWGGALGAGGWAREEGPGPCARPAPVVSSGAPAAPSATRAPRASPLSPPSPRLERQWGTFSALDCCNYALNTYDNGATLSVVVDSGAHGTHVRRPACSCRYCSNPMTHALTSQPSIPAHPLWPHPLPTPLPFLSSGRSRALRRRASRRTPNPTASRRAHRSSAARSVSRVGASGRAGPGKSVPCLNLTRPLPRPPPVQGPTQTHAPPPPKATPASAAWRPAPRSAAPPSPSSRRAPTLSTCPSASPRPCPTRWGPPPLPAA
jgi:hypothetical protein